MELLLAMQMISNAHCTPNGLVITTNAEKMSIVKLAQQH